MVDVNASTAVLHVAHDKSEEVIFTLVDTSETGLDFSSVESVSVHSILLYYTSAFIYTFFNA